MSEEERYRLVWSTENMMPLCSICDERIGYGDPCDECLDAIMEQCPHCLGRHSVLEQLWCRTNREDD
jgi:predicted amidophosphoribosyltransferase